MNMEAVTRLTIADASTLLREGLRRLLSDAKDLFIVGLAANDVETMELVEEKDKTDVLLLDLQSGSLRRLSGHAEPVASHMRWRRPLIEPGSALTRLLRRDDGALLLLDLATGSLSSLLTSH